MKQVLVLTRLGGIARSVKILLKANFPIICLRGNLFKDVEPSYKLAGGLKKVKHRDTNNVERFKTKRCNLKTIPRKLE